MLQKGIHMVDFIKPNGMSDDEVNQLNTRITMNVLYRALAAMPPELIDRALHDSTVRYSPMSRPNNHKIKIELG